MPAPVTKSFTVRIFNLENRGSTRRNFHAPSGAGYTWEGINSTLQQIADDLDKRFPQDDFSLVEVRPFAFNIVWRGKRQAPASLSPVAG